MSISTTLAIRGLQQPCFPSSPDPSARAPWHLALSSGFQKRLQRGDPLDHFVRFLLTRPHSIAKSFINLGRIGSAAMDLDFLDGSEETRTQTLGRRYAHLAAWVARANRPQEPARLPEPVRPATPPRINIPPRQPLPSRPVRNKAASVGAGGRTVRSRPHFPANKPAAVSPVSRLDCSLARGGRDGRLACRAIYGFRRSGAELDAGGARHYPGRDCPFVVVTALVRLLIWPRPSPSGGVLVEPLQFGADPMVLGDWVLGDCNFQFQCDAAERSYTAQTASCIFRLRPDRPRILTAPKLNPRLHHRP